MYKKSVEHINQNIDAANELIQNYEQKRESLKEKPLKDSHIYMGGAAGTMAGIVTAGSYVLDSGAMIIAGIFGGLAGASIPYVIKQIKIGELNYQIYMNGLIMKDLEKEKTEVSGNVKTLHK